jgi:hypothetical protein
MTDFFSMLVARTQTAEPSIAPRKPARFEDPSAVAEFRSEVPVPRPRRTIGAPNAPERLPHVSLVEPIAKVAAPDVRAAEVPDASREARVLADRQLSQSPALPVVIRELITHRETFVKEVTASSPVPAVASRPLESRVPDLSNVEPAKPDGRELPLAQPPVSTAITSLSPSVSPLPSAPAPPPAIIPHIELFRPPEAPPSATPTMARAAEPAPPRIEVTIGCVEVRAVAPATTPATVRFPTREPQPRVSLGDYLKQRRSARS